MRLSKSVWVDGEEYELRRLRKSDGDDCYGVCYTREIDGTREIAISLKISDARQAEILVHEVCHAALIPLKLHNKTEERIVLRLEAGLSSFLKDNPTLARRIINSLRG